MGGGGASTTTTQIPQSLQELWAGTTKNVLPLQQSLMGPSYSYTGPNGESLTQDQYNSVMGPYAQAQEAVDKAKQAYTDYHLSKGASQAQIDSDFATGKMNDGGEAYTAAKAALDALPPPPAGYTKTAGPNQFAQAQSYEDYYGKPGEGANYVPDTAYAALEQAMGGGGQSGFTQESKWAAPAASNAAYLSQWGGTDPTFAAAHPQQVADWAQNPAATRLAGYAGAYGTQYTNPGQVGNPDPYGQQPQRWGQQQYRAPQQAPAAAPKDLFTAPASQTGGATSSASQTGGATTDTALAGPRLGHARPTTPSAVTTKQETPGGTVTQKAEYNAVARDPHLDNQPFYPGAPTQPAWGQNTPAVQSSGNAAGWQDYTKPAYETGYVSQANQLQNIGAQTPTLGAMARDVSGGSAAGGNANANLVNNALSVWANTKLPTLQNQASIMGLGRSGALVKNIDSSQNQFLLPIIQQQMDYENQAIGRAQQGAQANVGALQAAAQAQTGRENTDYSRNLDIATKLQQQQQDQYNAQQADFLRQQGLSEQEIANRAQNMQAAGTQFQNLASADTARQQSAAQQLMSMAQTEKDWAAQPGDFAYQELLRQQGLGENSLYQPLGGAASAVGTTTKGGK